MNILVIGNGFDLAHGLPTKYGDFLEFIKVIRQVVKVHDKESLDSIEWGSVNSQIREIIERKMGNVRNNLISQKQMWDNLLEGNWWIDYFLQCDMYQKENWIDFESEISRVIQSIDQDMHNDKLDENAIIYKFSESYLADRFLDNMEQLVQERYGQAYEEMKKVEEAQGEKWGAAKESEYLSKFEEDHPFENLKEKITYKKLITKLENDLDRLIRALEPESVNFVTNCFPNIAYFRCLLLVFIVQNCVPNGWKNNAVS